MQRINLGNSIGTWQWSVLVLEKDKTAIGAHMWLQGYLTMTYQQLIQGYETEGFKVATFKKEKDKLMQFLTYALPLPEFQNESTEPRR